MFFRFLMFVALFRRIFGVMRIRISVTDFIAVGAVPAGDLVAALVLLYGSSTVRAVLRGDKKHFTF